MKTAHIIPFFGTDLKGANGVKNAAPSLGAAYARNLFKELLMNVFDALDTIAQG